METPRKKGLEVLYMTDPIDEYSAQQLKELTGVNQETYPSDMQAVSCASCATNCPVPMVKCIAVGIKTGLS